MYLPWPLLPQVALLASPSRLSMTTSHLRISGSLLCKPFGTVQLPNKSQGPVPLESWHCYMNELQSNRWVELCERATKEQDPDKLLELLTEINGMLELQQTQLRAERARRRLHE